jgi:hypothetical protein
MCGGGMAILWGRILRRGVVVRLTLQAGWQAIRDKTECKMDCVQASNHKGQRKIKLMLRYSSTIIPKLSI